MVQLQGALSRWCSSAHSSEDEAVILASSYIPADIKEAVCSTSPQVSSRWHAAMIWLGGVWQTHGCW